MTIARMSKILEIAKAIGKWHLLTTWAIQGYTGFHKRNLLIEAY